MSEIKPVALITPDELRHLKGGTTALVIPATRPRLLPEDPSTDLYALPDTHRIVSVDTLEHLFSSVYYAEDEALIRAIIDKEEST
jgi:hypothetical protein